MTLTALSSWHRRMAAIERDAELRAFHEHAAVLLTPERVWCMVCGKSVSSEVPKGTIVRAYVQCPECIATRGLAS